MTQSSEPATILDKIKFYGIVVVIALLLGNAFFGLSKKHDNYQKCVGIWRTMVRPIEVTSYDPDTGEANYRWPKMTKEFKSRCYARLER